MAMSRVALRLLAVALGIAVSGEAVAQTTRVVGAVLPNSRSAKVGETVTAFATIINTEQWTRTDCFLTPATNIPAVFSFQRTDPATNAPVGAANERVTLGAFASQTYVMSFTPVAAFAPTEVQMTFRCGEPPAAPILPGVNTISISGDAVQQPDVIALSATVTNDGVSSIPGANGTGFFAVATSNIGAGGPLTVSVDTGGLALPVTATLCRTNPMTGACLEPPAASLTRTFAVGENATFSVFLAGSGIVGFDPSANRAFVRFRDAQGALRGATSVAVRTTGAQPDNSQIAQLRISAPLKVIGLDESQTLGAVYTSTGGVQLPNPGTLWSSGSTTVATVNGAGSLNPVAQGVATLTAQGAGRSATADVRVVWGVGDADFSKPAGTKSQSGLLHGFNFTSAPTPPDGMVTPLKPTIWRTVPGVVPPARADAAGARYNIVLSDLWGYPVSNWPNGRPWVNTAAYVSMMRQAAQQYRNDVDVWEIWNEPDQGFGSTFWDGTEQQFFDTYLLAYNALRQELGSDAIIAGPSATNYDEGFLDRFATFCKANGCEANAIVWHGPYTKGQYIETIPQTLLRGRQRYLLDPANAALDVREIIINEFAGPIDRVEPLSPLLYMQNLEFGRADFSAKSCWPNTLNENDCYNNSLDGLLTASGEPRSNWRSHVLYAHGADTRVQARSSRMGMVMLPSVTPVGQAVTPADAKAQVLTGFVDIWGAPATADLGLRLKGLGSVPGLTGQNTVAVRIYEVAPSGEAAGPPPVLATTTTMAVTNGEGAVVIPSAVRGKVYQVVLGP